MTYRVGILTFHCADNYGAMLQAYGLKTYMRNKNIRTDIVRYEPPFMTGRHWWFPYIPSSGLRKIIRSGWDGWKRNLEVGRLFFKKRFHMRQFRKKYLVEQRAKKILFSNQLRCLNYQCYIVGSDQIWNPDITWKLQKVYFGNFKNRKKKKVIAYGASLGKASLPSEYDSKFAEMIKNIDYISVRESASIPYIKKFYDGDVCAVIDPVFLLKKEEWEKIEKLPDEERYILVYVTEYNEKLTDYVKKLAKNKNLTIIKVGGGAGIDGENVITDYAAEPAGFLGYIHKADYVVTNSFHGVAFSIIYQKQFIVFQHSSVGERINNILSLHGLQARVYHDNIQRIEIDSLIEWDRVRCCTEECIKQSDEFLLGYAGLKR